MKFMKHSQIETKLPPVAYASAMDIGRSRPWIKKRSATVGFRKRHQPDPGRSNGALPGEKN